MSFTDCRITQISDEGAIPSFFIRFRDPIETLTDNWNYVQSSDYHLAGQLIADASVLFVQRGFTPLTQCLMQDAKRLDIPVVYETDDLLFDLPPESTVTLGGLDTGSIQGMISGANVVTCSTHALSRKLAEYNPRVRVLKNYAVPFGFEEARSARAGDPHAVIVNTDYFKIIRAKEELFAALRLVISRFGYCVSFFGSVDPCMESLRMEFPNQVNIISSFTPSRRAFLESLMKHKINVAVVPLELSLHHAFKSDIKFLDYASLAVPGIYNNSEVYNRVEHGRTGFLCRNTLDGWLEGLEYFASDTNRSQCGDAAYEEGCKRTLNDYAGELASILMELRAESSKAQSLHSTA